jgi:tRNA-specific 2-thiouridylase
MKRVLLGLSGGVDSAVAAWLLKKQGYEVIGAFMKNFSETKNPITEECNWVEEKIMAQKVAAFLNIPLIILDLEKQYTSQVIKPMIEKYAQGLTPNPDIACNTLIKFPWLRKAAKEHKCEFIAT